MNSLPNIPDYLLPGLTMAFVFCLLFLLVAVVFKHIQKTKKPEKPRLDRPCMTCVFRTPSGDLPDAAQASDPTCNHFMMTVASSLDAGTSYQMAVKRARSGDGACGPSGRYWTRNPLMRGKRK